MRTESSASPSSRPWTRATVTGCCATSSRSSALATTPQPTVRRRSRPGGGISRALRSSTRSCSYRSEEHTSELQSLTNLVCRLLLEKKKKYKKKEHTIDTRWHVLRSH